MPGKSGLLVALTLCLISCKPGAHSAAACAPLDGSSRSKLIAYVQKRYNVPVSVPIEVTEVGLMGESCYRKLDFHAKNGGPLHITLYASPDLRFLSHDLMDSGIQPVQQDARKNRDLAADLARGNPASMGPKDAPVTITVFSDFECPYCARIADGLAREILPSENGKVRVLFRNFPLSMHPWARPAAEAAACARLQGNEYFWSLHNYLFRHQRDLKPETLQNDLLAYAASMPGFQVAKWRACVDGHATAAAIEQDIVLGKDLGVTGTPTVFVGSERSVGYRPDEIRALIHRAKGAPAGLPKQARVKAADLAAALSRGNPAVMGDRNTPVSITLFSDFQCPFCARTADGLVNEILPGGKGKVRVLFRNFPLSMHPWAREAAEAAECARQQGEPYFRRFHDYFFQHQRELKADTLRKEVLAYAEGLQGLQTARLNACMEQKAAASVVEQDLALGKELGVTGTPTLFVGSERIVGYRPDEIRTLIEQASKTGQTR